MKYFDTKKRRFTRTYDNSFLSKVEFAIFTLVELLVVIAVIALLASLLLPALKNAKEKANEALCMSNMKQQGLCFQQYTEDYNQFYPNWLMPDGYTWAYYLLPYCGQTYIDYGIFRCPSVKVKNVGSWAFLANTYAFNRELDYQRTPTIKNPSFLYVELESPWGSIATVNDRKIWAGDVTDTSMKVDPRHNNRSSVLFADIHAQIVKPENSEPLNNFPAAPGTEAYKKAWYQDSSSGRW